MPLIHAIEVSNFLNHRRKAPWTPDWRCNRFLLGGYHAALNIPNGRGKSTMMLMLLAMLAGKTKKLNELMRKHAAPESTGSFTHLRIEITHRNPDHEDLLQELVGPGDGEKMVFGLYGNVRDGSTFDFYAYRGTFDDCPLSTQTGPIIDLATREEFLECLRKRPGLYPSNQKERQVEEWRRFIAEHFDSASILQQYAYQAANAAEGASTYFEVESKTGNYSAQLFYKHLAPELLADVMGSHGEEDERGIEDTIHEKASSVVRARKRTKETARELDEAERILERLRELDEEVRQIEAAQADLHATRQPLIEELCVLEDAVLKNPIPGSPRPPLAEDPDLFHYMLLQREEWWITDQGLASLLNEPVKALNQRVVRALKARPDTTAQKTQAIDLSCDLARFVPARGGHPAKLYNLPDAITLCLDAMSDEAESDRGVVVAQLNAAFAWAREHADTNPARREIRNSNLQLAAIAVQNRTLEEEAGSLQGRSTELRREEDGLRSGGMAWETLQKSGCFSEQELADPVRTAAVVVEESSCANLAFDEHNKVTSERQSTFLQWQAFRAEYGEDASPGTLAADLEREEVEARQQVEEADGKHAAQASLVAGLVQQHKQAKSDVERLRESHSTVTHYLPGTRLFHEIFAGESAKGLEQQVHCEHDEAKSKRDHCSDELRSLAGAISALEAFSQTYPNREPAQWLRARADERKQLGEQETTIRLALGRGQELLERAEEHWQAATLFELRFEGLPTEGLEAQVQREFESAQASLRQDEQALAALQPDLAAIEQFQQRFPGAPPGEWLTNRSKQAIHAGEVISASRPRLDSLLAQQHVVVEHRSGAETYDAYFLSEDPYGLTGKVDAELASAKLRRGDALLSLAHIQADLDAVEVFRAEVVGLEPGLWLEQWHTSRSAAEQALAETREEYERAGERRRILDKDPVVPSSTARAAMDVAGVTAQPLYAFIDSLELGEARKEAVLSLFSALIFAPVLPSVEAAAEVAARLSQADIDVPVLVSGPLGEFCRSGSISYRDGVADSWLVGVKTWPVACLLDPGLLQQERARLDVLLSELLAQIGERQASFDRFVAEEPFTHIAEQAQDAIERRVPERGADLKAFIQGLDEDLPRLERRASAEAQRAIESRLITTETLGLTSNAGWGSILHSVAEMERLIEELQARIDEAQAVLVELERDADQEANAAIAAKAIDDGKPAQAEQLRGSISNLLSALPGLEDRASKEARLSIRAMASLQGLLRLSPDASWQVVLEARTRVEEDLAVRDATLQNVLQSIERWDQASSIEPVAREAAAAIENRAPEKHAAFVSLAQELDQSMPRLATRASFDAVTSIRAMCAVEQVLQGRSLDELSLAIEAAATMLDGLTVDLSEREAALEALVQFRGKSQERLVQALGKSRQIDGLRRLQSFADHPEHGPDFMAKADEVRGQLERAREYAQRRAAFDFEGVAQFVESGGNVRLIAIQAELGLAETRLQAIVGLLKENQEKHEQLRSEQEPLRRAERLIDESIIRVRRGYLERKKVIPEPVSISPEQLRSHELYRALHPAGEFSHMDRARSMEQACESLSSGEAEQLQQRFSEAGKDLQRHTESFIKLIDKVLGDTHLKLPEVARTQLRQARENPSLVTVMLQASQVSFDENVKVNRIADEHLAEERAGLSSWLTNFTLRLPDNLKILRSVLAPKVDQTSKAVLRAGFVVEAKVIDSEGVQTLIESIIQDVENYEDNEQAKESSVRDHLRKSLREDIRRNFYQKVIVNPRIYLVLPAMSATPLEMERDMASSGQGIAITFLWILRLSEFITEREIRRQTVGRAQRQRLRDRSTSFTILDGAFSHLSSKSLIDETLKGIEDTTGRFQLIVTVHDPAYQNDFNRFPALVVAREMQGHYMRAWSHLNEVGDRDALGQDSLATFQAIRVARAAKAAEESR
jgi:hypothetical protein